LIYTGTVTLHKTSHSSESWRTEGDPRCLNKMSQENGADPRKESRTIE